MTTGHTQAAPATVSEAPAVAEAKAKADALRAERRRVAEALARPDETAAELAERLLQDPSAGPDPVAPDKAALRVRAEALDRAIVLADRAVEQARMEAGQAILQAEAPTRREIDDRIGAGLAGAEAALEADEDFCGELKRRGVPSSIGPVPVRQKWPALSGMLAEIARSVKPRA